METSESSFKTPCKVERKKSSGPVTPSPSFAIPASPFMKKFGYGTGVSVYLMKRSPKGLSHSPWAVKKVNKQCDKSSKNLYEQRLNDEAKILKNLQHPNIIGYRGLTKTNDGSLCLAMEYGGEKSLNDLIEERNEKCLGPFPADTILKVALNMARGLKYLHIDKKILHGDIKSSNVVIKGDFESIKICDVGVSLPLDENMISEYHESPCEDSYAGSGGSSVEPRFLHLVKFSSLLPVTDQKAYYIGTESWKPKEALEEDGVITDKSDIYAFGLTLWEMMTLSIPHLNLPPEDDDDEEDSFEEDDFDEDAYYEALGTRPPLNADELNDSYQRVIELFYLCSNEDPKERPSAAQIVEALEAENIQ
ncbi:lymphokine-activated killer T-cell-originated protein kinase isoform X1 [Bufo bufo]|uniref:lymphokine-activated killer T-cell-originated protein kinase isoform X1 n=1 Tax=Bufo bufo TaxID=8384 RepID=UPI001ABE7C01|nr:lymphokine-activated killer T-cell-originated protein kinase isoform X1 [Bufo bufo]